MSISASEVIEKFNNDVQSWTSPVWFNEGLAALPSTVKDNGSCGFLSSGNSRFLVTAQHVLNGFRQAKALNANTVFAVNIGDGKTVAIAEPVVIDEEQSLDIATIDFPHLAETTGQVSKKYFPLDQWPVGKATKQMPVSVVGFPGQGRHQFENFGLFEPIPLNMLVTDVGPRRIILAEQEMIFSRRGKILQEGVAVGGFSGSPAFGLTETGVCLVGVVRDGVDRLGCKGSRGWIALGPTEYLLQDGHFDRTKITW